ncbi:MAG: PAS domain S-box protein [Clostridium sp.]|uniref:PAS domain S-box protein n=1 Tax=Clostridium sp. TaxID=1506 RepID=UPI0025C40E98|nr:PAS domain S-box protein [Clostridium sp.]MCE5219818.1 PAS domain S-box protein [Clostridium sp.]
MRYTLKRALENPFLYSKNKIVTDINEQFENITGYTKKEIIGKSLTEISKMLRIDSQIYLENIDDKYECYLFTKKHESREVIISCRSLESNNEKIYFFKEKLNSRIEDIFPYASSLISDNEIGTAIFSVNDEIMLKVNEKFLAFMGASNNEVESKIGKALEEISTEYNGSNFKKMFLNVIRTGKAFSLKEVKCENLEMGDTYWDISIVPIYISGKVKYIINTFYDITEKILSRKIIEEKNKRLEAIIENMSDVLYIIDKDYNITYLNNASRGIYGGVSIKKAYTLLKYNKYYDDEGNLLTFENLPAVRVLKGEKLKDYRYTSHSPDGIYHISFSGSPKYDNSGNVIKAVICSRDITEQVNRDKMIKQQKEELEVILENMSDGLFIIDKENTCILANKLARDILLISSENRSLKDLHEQIEFLDAKGNLVGHEDLPSSKIMRGERVFAQRFTVKQKDKVIYIEVNATPIYDKEDNFVAGIVCLHDITEQISKDELIKMQKDELIRIQNDQLETIIENIYDCLVVFNKDGNIIKHSKTIEDYIKNHSEITTIDDYFRHIEVSDLDGNSFSEENSLVTRIVNGEKMLGYKFAAKIYNTVFYFELNGNPIYDSKENFVAGVLIIRDITEEVKYKNKMEETLKIQDEVFANISHELKTPLNVIYSTNQLIELYLKNDSFEANKGKISKSLNVIKQNCYRFSKLINNIVDLSKIDSGFLKLSLVNENIVCVIENIVESVSEYINGKGIDIVFDTNTEEKIIACDPEKIERIILNLISNAIKFTNSGGIIYIDLIDKGEVIEIAIKDTGVGIDKKHENIIFKRFYQVDKSLTRNAEGSGIGLSVVKSLVELHDGKISIESKVGEGSVFKIELPSRTIEKAVIDKIIPKDNKIEMINIEFSDIYSI